MQDETRETGGTPTPENPNPPTEQPQEQPAAAEQPTQPAGDGAAQRPAVDASEVNTLTPEPGQDVGESQVQERIDAEQEAGFRGVKMDPTPNSHYAAANSNADNDLPTPETDADLRRQAAANRRLDGPGPY